MFSRPGDHAQQRGLAAARRADEDDELAVVDVDVDAVDDLGRARALSARRGFQQMPFDSSHARHGPCHVSVERMMFSDGGRAAERLPATRVRVHHCMTRGEIKASGRLNRLKRREMTRSQSAPGEAPSPGGWNLKSIEILATGNDDAVDHGAARSHLHAAPSACAAGRDAFLASVGPRIRGVATGGHCQAGRSADVSRLPKLEIVANFGVGYDSVDAAWAGQHMASIVTNTPDVLTEEVADTALGLLLMTVRELSRSERYLRAGQWVGKGALPAHAHHAAGQDGRHPRARAASARPSPGAARRSGSRSPITAARRRRTCPTATMPASWRWPRDVDILLSVAPGGPETFHIIDAEVLRALGPQGILINIGRGSVVDEGALINALKNKAIHSAGPRRVRKRAAGARRADRDGSRRAAAACRLGLASTPAA